MKIRVFGGRQRRPRCCDKCGKPYLRRNLAIGWTRRNVGHRDGWVREEMRTCMRCTSTEQAQRMLVMVSVGRAVEPVKVSRVALKR